MTARRRPILAALAAALFAAACGEQPASDPNRTVRKGGVFVKEEVTQQGGFFYRLEAHYTVKATGEPIDFDIVVACNIRTTNYTYTGPSFVAERYPEVMAKATKDGNAVMIKTPRVCQQLQLDRGYVPDDFVPFAIWFDDVNDLSFGWGYATQDAYDGPSAKIAYRPTDPEKGTYTAKITRVSRAEWEAWRKKAAEDWVQIGALPGPWGYADPKDKAGIAEEDRVRALNGGKWLGIHCNAISHIPLPADELSKLSEVAKEEPSAQVASNMFISNRFEKIREAELSMSSRLKAVPRDFGFFLAPVSTQRRMGTVLHPPAIGWIPDDGSRHQLGYVRYYPLVSYIDPNNSDMQKNGYVRQILFGPEWSGFAACGFIQHSSSRAANAGAIFLANRDLEIRPRTFPILLNRSLLVSNGYDSCGNTACVPTFYSLEGFSWHSTPNPGG